MDAEISLGGAVDLNTDAVDFCEEDVNVDVVTFGDLGESEADSESESDSDDDDDDGNGIGGSRWGPWQDALDANKDEQKVATVVEEDDA